MPKKPRTAATPFTTQPPRALDVEKRGEHWWATIAGRELRLSNLTKIYWPDDGYTKGDLLAYYHNVAPLILPHLAQRPLTMKRMPDGIDGPHFYEKSAPSHTPDWIPRCPIPNEDGEITDYMVAADEACLLFVANLGAIEFHPLHQRCGTDRPDYLFFDLDPFEPASFADVTAVARHVRAALDALGLPSYPKTSGATGMQIYVPIQHGPTYEQTRAFVGAIGRMILRADPERVTMEWEISKRTGKIFIDHNMNREGANIAAVYSVRPEPGATVSTPLEWSEVEQGVHPGDFTIANVHERFARTGDLFEGVRTAPVDLRPALAALGLPAAVDPADSPEPERRVTLAGGTPRDRRLTEYIRKRDLAETPEPGPSGATGAGNGFVIHKHNATRLHYDLRLEHDGALESWAVPKGLPVSHGEKRLAVNTEPHPLEYADFEGWIPEGHYGAGESLIFDRGTYETLEWTPDKVTFRLNGRRLTGEYHLVKTGQGWLVFLSKNTPARPPPPLLQPMLAEAGGDAFDDPAWRFEPKMDGIRTIATIATDATRLHSRTGRDHTALYPELANLAQYVNALHAVLDGEIVAADAAGRPSFERLQQRMNLQAPREIDRARKQIPVTLFVFDALWLDGADLTREPLQMRREILERIVTPSDALQPTIFVDGAGTALFASAKKLGFEGVVAKRLGSTYQPGRRSRDWRKIKATNRIDCVILGWTPGEGSRAHGFGSLLLGAYRGDEPVWIGQVGTGFTEAAIDKHMTTLKELEVPESAFPDPKLKAIKGARFVRPELVCEVEYLQITADSKLRAPSFKGLRPDKAPEDCRLEELP
ncbi:MAG: non-homologous end-joining DNA ligase [Actinomycetota bacterium]